MTDTRRFLATTFLAATVATGSAHAADATVRVERDDVPPRLDGRLDDAAWQRAGVHAGFAQVTPTAGAPPTRRTELRLVHDGRSLFIAIRAHDDAPAGIVARTLQRDNANIAADDNVTLVFDPQGTARNGFVFTVNALGARQDGIVYDASRTALDWDSLFDAAAAIDAEGWSAEVAIPFSALAAPDGEAPWRFNAERFVAASGERMRLFGASADREVDSLTDAGALTGAQAGGGTLGLRLQPTLRWTSRRRAGGERESRVEPGLDAFYRVTPGVTAALTLNTDFSDVEADERVVNLTRFELFRPEKRAFFTQDAGRFASGGLDGGAAGVLPFFSRRIGLAGNGEPLALDVGLKLSGSAGPFEFGALATQVERSSAADAGGRAPRMGVVRIAGHVTPTQRLGLIATHGNPEGRSGSHLGGIDYQFRRSDFAGDRTLEADAWLLESRNAGAGRGRAAGGSVAYPNLGLTGSASWSRIDAAFAPALGFVAETGIRSGEAELGWWHRTDAGSDVIPTLSVGGRRRLDGSERSGSVGPGLEWTTAEGD